MIIIMFLLRQITCRNKINNLIMVNKKAFFGELLIIFLCLEKLTGLVSITYNFENSNCTVTNGKSCSAKKLGVLCKPVASEIKLKFCVWRHVP